MRFMMMYKPGYENDDPPTPEMMAAVGGLIEDMSKAGVLVATEGFHSSARGCRISLKDGKFTITDGPFAEAKELIAGFAIVDVKSMEEAQEYAKRFLKVTGGGDSEIRQVMGATDFTQDSSHT